MLEELKNIAIADFDYPLPDSRIAKHPAEQRDNSKLLALRGTTITEHHFNEIPSLIPEGATLVFNDTRVIHARLKFKKQTGALIEILCLEPYQSSISECFEQRDSCSWVCLVGNNKRWREGMLSNEVVIGSNKITLKAEREEMVGNAWVVHFSWDGGFSFAEVIEHAGEIPLPPYLGRETEDDDAERYQTVYARHDGSVAAPTAGLHFTPQLINKLHSLGFSTEYLTLHVGAGTFKPVSTETIGGHDMHVEKVVVGIDTIRNLSLGGCKPLIAVGTTSVRTLESLYWFGNKLHRDKSISHMSIAQWEPYECEDSNITFQEACCEIVAWLERNGEAQLVGETQLLIVPGYRFRSINGLITNFHQPKSTLLLLVSALIGDRWRECYQYALSHDFRFLSYGDSCLFLP